MIRSFFKWLMIYNWFAKIVNHNVTQIALPSITAAYVILYEIDFYLLSPFPHAKKNLLVVLIVSTLLVNLFNAIANAIKSNSNDRYTAFLENFMVSISKVVESKLLRFKQKSHHLKKGGNIFKVITQPEDQIGLIHSESIDWLRSTFSLEEDEICITIMHTNGSEQKQYFAFDTQPKWQHTKAKSLLTNASTASKCLERGENIFHSSKELAEKNGEYLLSERDKRKGDGSIFCYPVVTECADYTDQFVISIVTYGKRMCTPGDIGEEKITKMFLNEICKRLDIELTLYSIKSWQQKQS